MFAAISSTGCGQPKTQAKVEFVLYFLFFFPGVLALIMAGWKYSARSWRYLEVSVMSPANVPIFQFKATIVSIAGVLLFLQGIAQVMRCIICACEPAFGCGPKKMSKNSRTSCSRSMRMTTTF